MIGMGLDDKSFVKYLGMAECHVVALKATSSAVDSVYGIFKEAAAAVELRDLDENTTKFLTVQKALDSKIKNTVAQLNCCKLPDAANVVSCIEAVSQQDAPSRALGQSDANPPPGRPQVTLNIESLRLRSLIGGAVFALWS